MDGTHQWFLVVLAACVLLARIFFYGPFFFLGAGLQRWMGPLQRLPVWAGLTGVLVAVADLWRAADRDVPWSTLFILFLAASGVPAFMVAHRARFNGLFEYPGSRPGRAGDGRAGAPIHTLQGAGGLRGTPAAMAC